MKSLFAFRGLTHDPQRVLAVIHRLAFVGIKLGFYLGLRATFELQITAFADPETMFYDTQITTLHNRSLAHLPGAD
jgi:hypothetical protein